MTYFVHRCLVVAMILSLALTGCGGQPSKARSLDLVGPWEWTFSSSADPANSVTFNLILADNNDVLGPQTGTTVTVTTGDGGSQCTTPASFAARIAANFITGAVVSCEGTFKFQGTMSDSQSVKGTFTSNGWGTPGGTFEATPLSTPSNTWSGNNIFSGQTTFIGPITSSGSNQFTGQNTFSSPGVFTNTANTDNGISKFVLNNCNPSSEWSSQQGGTANTSALIGCVTVPSSSTAHQSTAVSGYSDASSAATMTVGGYFMGRCHVANCQVWGANPIAVDGGFQALQMYGSEIDVNVSNSASYGKGLLFNGAWSAQPTRSTTGFGNMPAIGILQPIANRGGPYYWSAGFGCAAGATDNGDGTGTGDCIDLGPAAASGPTASQGITFHGRTAANGIVSSKVAQTQDSSNRAQLTWLDESNGSATFITVLPVHGTSNYQLSGNNFITSGSCTLSSGSCSYTFSNAYLNPPNCTANGRSAANAMLVSSTTKAVTITSSSGTDSQVVSFLCVPTAN